MTIEECYAALGGNYSNAMGRLQKFTDDGTFALLRDSLAGGNKEDAFRAAHTMKGMCQNLSFDLLAESSAALTEALRAGDMEEGKRLFPAVERDYAVTVKAIQQYKAANAL